MYKVFIDNWPILIVYPSTFLTSVQKSSIVRYNSSTENNELWRGHKRFKDNNEIMLIEIPEGTLPESTIFKNFKLVIAAGGVVKNLKNDILVMERLGCWDLPKGKVEPGEAIELAAIREVEEECGITAPEIKKILTVTYHTYHMKGVNHLKITYWYLMHYDGHQELIPQIEESITKVCWWPNSIIHEILENTYLSIADVIKAYLKNELNN